VDQTGTAIERHFIFKNFHQTMAFTNAVAWIAHQENHHPDLKIGYQNCIVTYSTHAINGLTENDFICAAKIC
jgi:4a-hydroxytetrahydrobiopterin dehydratase